MPPILTTSSIQMSPQASAPINMLPNTGVPMPVPAPQPVPPVLSGIFPSTGDIDLRSVMDPRLNRNLDQDMRSLGAPNPPNMANPMDVFNQVPVPVPRPAAVPPSFPSDPRQRPVDPRMNKQNQHQQQQQQQPQQQRQVGPPPPPPPSSQPPVSLPPAQQARAANMSGIPNDASDQDKAALIMQVLQLSDEQISMLPPEQRASILVLKEQIAKSTQQR